MKSIFSITIFLLKINMIVYSQNFKNSIERIDNDYVTYEDYESLRIVNPKKVTQKFKKIVKDLKINSKNLQSYSYTMTINDSLSGYALMINSFDVNKCYFYVYNKVNNSISDKPVTINMKWAYNNEGGFTDKLLDYPLFTFSVNEKNLISFNFKERVHDGNIYNAVLLKVYNLKNDLNFDLQYCYEPIAFTLDNQKIKRIMTDKFIYVYLEGNTSFEYLGKVETDIPTKKINKKECDDKRFLKILFSCSGQNDDEIFKNGFNIDY